MDDFRTPEDLFKEGTRKVGKAGKDISKHLPVIIGLLVIMSFLKGLIYQIGPNEVGVIQRFGEYKRTVEPGLHVKMPLGIEKVTPVKVRKNYTEEFGFRTLSPGVRTRYSKQKYLDESLMLTGDLNILDVRWIVQFRIADPVKLLFKARDPRMIVRDMSEVIMSRMCGDYRVDEMLTTKRNEINVTAQIELQKLLDRYETGIVLETVKLQDVNPPEKVKAAFNEVNEAKQERERMINEAWEAYNKVIPKAKGEALRTVSQAEGYALDKVNRSEGEANRFLETWQAYKKAPAITRKRLHIETMADVLPGVDKKFLMDPEQKGILPFMDLNKEGGE